MSPKNTGLAVLPKYTRSGVAGGAAAPVSSSVSRLMGEAPALVQVLDVHHEAEHVDVHAGDEVVDDQADVVARVDAGHLRAYVTSSRCHRYTSTVCRCRGTASSSSRSTALW